MREKCAKAEMADEAVISRLLENKKLQHRIEAIPSESQATSPPVLHEKAFLHVRDAPALLAANFPNTPAAQEENLGFEEL